MPPPDPRKTIPGTSLGIPREANVINAGRAGHDDRDQAILHLKTMTEQGYITPEEASVRIDYAMHAGKQADLRELTSDLPALPDSRSWLRSYDWDNTKHWVPVVAAGMFLSITTAVIPPSLLAEEHLFPHNPLGLGFGVLAILTGIFGFVFCLVAAVTKAN
jgi:Domain of unknown function (DUF1707)